MEELLALLPCGGLILEFGAGTGEQARFLSEQGFNVIAIDLPDSVYASDRVFQVQDYDGYRIPLDDQSVDVIFSSNVLEHVEDLATVFGEFRRILRPGGTGLHIMPTPAWRFWSLVTGLSDAVVTLALLPFRLAAPPPNVLRRQALCQNLRRIARGVLPRGHGISREAFSELWTFSPETWRGKFRNHGFEVIEDRPMRLFYTGTVLFGLELSFEIRRRLSSILGSSMHIYLTQPTACS